MARSWTISASGKIFVINSSGTIIDSFGGSLPTSAQWDKTVKTGTAMFAGTTETDVIQAGAGKVWIITEIHVTASHPNAAEGGVTIKLTDSANVLIATLLDTTMTANSGLTDNLWVYKLAQPIVLNSQEKIRAVNGTATSQVMCTAIGFEES